MIDLFFILFFCCLVVFFDRENKLIEFCRIKCGDSGVELKGLTTEPGVQFYSGNFLNGTHKGKGRPDLPNHPNFPTTILKKGEKFESTTTYSFDTFDN